MKPSVVRRLSRLLLIQGILVVLVMAIFAALSVKSVSDELFGAMDNALALEGRSMEDKLSAGNVLLERLIYRNDNYSLLQSESDSARYFAAWELSEMLADSISYSADIDAAVIAESVNATVLLRGRDWNLPLATKEALGSFTLAQAERGAAKARWQLGHIGDETYVYKLYIWDHTAVGVYLTVERFMALPGRYLADEGIHLMLLDEEGRVWGTGEQGDVGQTIGEPFVEPGYLLKHSNSTALGETGFQLLGRISASAVWGMLRGTLLLLILLTAILAAFTLLMTVQLRREVIAPISELQEDLEQLGDGAQGRRVRESYPSREFEALSRTLNRQLDTIRHLRIASYEKQLALQETELRAIKLQIRPHFFLNAMTTISSLSQQGKTAEIKTYISALAKNIRYMFRSGLHTVPLSEEIAHVENYFEMQELKYPGCVFHSIELMPGCESWAVPQMLVHTIIENEYKYAVSVDQMLSILIQAEIVPDGDDSLLRLTIEDDGAGYPQEVLDAFSRSSAEMRESADGKRVGLWSLRKMLYLMYDREVLFRIENTEPHGCRNIFLLPERPLHEGEELPQVKID